MTWVEFLHIVRWAENSDAVTNPTICYGRHLGEMMEGISDDPHTAIYLVKSRDRTKGGRGKKRKKLEINKRISTNLTIGWFLWTPSSQIASLSNSWITWKRKKRDVCTWTHHLCSNCINAKSCFVVEICILPLCCKNKLFGQNESANLSCLLIHRSNLISDSECI